MNDKIRKIAVDTDEYCDVHYDNADYAIRWEDKFAELIIKECISIISSFQVPVGNSDAGEIACEMALNSLEELRSDIKEHFGIE